MIKTIEDLKAASPEEVERIRRRIDVLGTIYMQTKKDARRVAMTQAEYDAKVLARKPKTCPKCEGAGQVTEHLRHVGSLHPSGAYKCRTRQYYEMIAEEPYAEDIDPELFYIFAIGTAVHVIFQGCLHRALGDRFEDEVRVELAEALVEGGAADGVIDGDEYRVVNEFKTMGGGYDKLTSPKKEHILQASIYAKALDVPFISFLYFHKENSEMKEFVIPFDERAYNTFLREKVAPIEAALWSRIPPIADAAKGECGKCPIYNCQQKIGERNTFHR